MINLGVDFGSTYTMVSIFRDGRPETVQPDNLTFSYPSIVVFDKNKKKYFFGTSARNKLGQPDIIPFRGFKMLLNGLMSPEQLKKRNYDDVNTPEYITELFLRHVIDNTLKKINGTMVDTLVLGAPECWFQSMETADSRAILRNICCKIEKIKNVRIVSEPTNAAAYGIWCYKKQKNLDFNGSVLVVDYGGGTLDTALVSIRHKQNDRLIIKPEMRSGRGENRDQEIGSAGIAYQEAVVRRAICENLGIKSSEIKYDADFDKAVKALEDELVSNAGEVEQTFEDYEGSYSMLRSEHFLSVLYDNQTININYGHLTEVYNKVINPILNSVLDETTNDISRSEEIYLLPVGGFCNFYLVRKQILDYFDQYFGWGKIGERDRVIRLREDEREKAIAHGACLFSDNILDLCYVAQYGIGMYTYFSDGKPYENYAINFGQEYVPDEVYFSKDDDGDISVMMLTKLDTFLINFSKNKKNHLPPMKPIQELARKLNAVKCGYLVVVGFSIDARERLTVHIYEYNNDPGHRGPSSEPVASISLNTFRESFQNTIIK